MTAGEGFNVDAVAAMVKAIGGRPARYFVREDMPDALAAALPLLRPSDVPHVVTQVREQIAGALPCLCIRSCGHDGPHCCTHGYDMPGGHP